MEKMLVYPFDVEFCPFVRHASLIDKFTLEKLVSPSGWGCAEKDAGYADGGPATGKIVESDFEAALQGCDALLVADSVNELDFKKYILPKILVAASENKKVYLSRELSQSERKLLQDSVPENLIENFYGEENLNLNPVISEKLSEFDTPIVFVLGSCERTSKFEIQLSIREELLRAGYCVSQVGSRHNCELLGFHSMPRFMWDLSLPDDKKIIFFNHYIKNIELREKPDIIVIGIPGGVMPINNRFTNHFGLKAFEISQAAMPDYVIFSSTYEDYKEDYFDNIGTSIKNRLGYHIDVHIVSNGKIDWADSVEVGYISYLTLDHRFVSSKLLKYENTKVKNIFQDGASEKLCNDMIGSLSEYAYVKSI